MSATITVPSAPWRSPYEEIEVSLADLVARVRETAIEWSPPDVLALLTLRADLETDRKLLDDYRRQIDELLADAIDHERTARAAIMRSVGAS